MPDQTRSITPTTNGQRRGELARRETRWDPFALFDDFQQDMGRFWNEPFGFWPMRRPFQPMAQMPGRWVPRVDVYEKDDQLVIEAELPSVKKEDVRVDLESGDLVIRGETRQQQEVKDEHYYRSERSFGTFHRRIPLSFDVDANQVQASMTDGVLEVHIPKPAEARTESKRIQLK